MDTLETAIVNACGAESAAKLKVAINIGANELFDQVTQKKSY